MNITTENILLIGSVLLFLSLFAGKTSVKSGIPILVIFLVIGMLAGSEGIGKIHFDNPNTAQFIGIIALNFILFSGGFDTAWPSVRPIMWQGIALSSLAVVITATSIGLFVWAVTDFTLYEGLLLGSIVSSTDSAAVFSILRSKGLGLKGHLRPLLELESGSNDPMAYILTIVFTGLVMGQHGSFIAILPLFVRQLLLGAFIGLLMGRVGKWLINWIKLDYEGLYIVLVIAIMFFSFSLTDFLKGNGFLAVYLCALYLGNQELIHKKKYIKSFDSYAWLMQIVLFLTLGLLVYPSDILPFVGIGMLISGFIILVARPLSVYISLMPFKIQNRCRLLISWVGLRGAASIVFATYPMLAGVEKASVIFNIVFFISLTSVIIQGTTLPVFARLLHLTVPDKVKLRTSTDLQLEDSIKSMMSQMTVPIGSPAAGKQIVHLHFPKTSLISIIQRNGSYITPNGSTIIEPNDKLVIISENKSDLLAIAENLGLVMAGGDISSMPGKIL